MVYLGTSLCKGHAGAAHLLLDVALDQCAEDIQDCAQQGVQPEMQHPAHRRDGRPHSRVLTCGTGPLPLSSTGHDAEHRHQQDNKVHADMIICIQADNRRVLHQTTLLAGARLILPKQTRWSHFDKAQEIAQGTVSSCIHACRRAFYFSSLVTDGGKSQPSPATSCAHILERRMPSSVLPLMPVSISVI